MRLISLFIILYFGILYPAAAQDQRSGDSVGWRLRAFKFCSYSSPAISPNGKIVALFESDTSGQSSLLILNNNGILITKLPNAVDVSFSKDSRYVLFFREGSRYCFDVVLKKEKAAFVLPDDQGSVQLPKIPISDPDWQIDTGSIEYSRDSSYLLFWATRFMADSSFQSDCIIWRTTDKWLPTQEEAMSSKRNILRRLFAYNPKNGNVVSISKANERQSVSASLDKYACVYTQKNWAEETWNINARSSYYLVSLKDGSRFLIADKLLITEPVCSPDGKFLVYFDLEDGHYYSYKVQSNETVCITQGSGTAFAKNAAQTGRSHPFNFGIAGWMLSSSQILVYGEFDIYALDLEGRNRPVSVTKGYGRQYSTVLRVASINSLKRPSLKPISKILLTGFDINSKKDGFLWLLFNMKDSHVKPISMDNCIYQYPFSSEEIHSPLIVKSTNSNWYIVPRTDNNTPLSFYATQDFKTFKCLTNNNLTPDYEPAVSQLVPYFALDDTALQGILYRPSNFDSTKKYPVIIYFYEDNSNTLNNFVGPRLSDGRLPVKLFIDNGYLVFDPSIHYKIGDPYESAYSGIVGAAKCLSKFSFVDSTRMGLQGISWGAAQINYIITRTDMFTAVAVSAGVSNLISSYNELRPRQGVANQYHAESGQGRMGGTLWEHKEAYLKGSAILHADRVNTPLLIEHNDKDEAVPFSQGVEWFLAMRRLGKKAWLLQYKGEGHGLVKHENQLDYTNKLIHFFNHYLKDASTPKWMAEEISDR